MENAKTFDYLAVTHPEVSKQWDYDKNGDLNPSNVTKGSGKKVFWKCEKGHSWPALICSRTKGKTHGCPYCSGRMADELTCLATTHPEISKQWDYDKNIDLTPLNVSKGSGKIAWWNCNNGHSFSCEINKRKSPSHCPYCSNQKVGKENCLAVTNPELISEWSKKNNITPFDVVGGSRKKVLWICQKGHESEGGILEAVQIETFSGTKHWLKSEGVNKFFPKEYLDRVGFKQENMQDKFGFANYTSLLGIK